MKLTLSEIIDKDDIGLEIPTTRISEKRIKKAVISRIAPPKRAFRRKFVTAVAVLLLITAVTTTAAAYSDNFRVFLSEGFDFLNGKSQPINKSDTQNGITMTVESAINDGNSALVLVSFKKEDNSAFTDAMYVSDFEITSDGLSFAKQKQLSDDKKTMYYLFKLQSSDMISKQKITLSANDMVVESNEGDEVSELDLGLLYNENPLSLNGIHDVPGIQQNFSKELLKNGSAILQGIAFKDSDLYIYYEVSGNPDDVFIKHLINVSSGENILPVKEYVFEADNKKMKCAVFENVRKEELSNLKITTHYQQVQKITAQWKADFKLQNGQSVQKNTDMVIQSGSHTLRIEKVDINMLGISAEGTLIDDNGKPMENLRSIQEPVILNITFQLDDGESIKLPTASIEISNEDKLLFLCCNPVPIDLSKVEAVIINNEALNLN